MNVEEVQLKIDRLTAERQDLRAAGSSAAAIERNRVQLARAQWELAHALIDEHLSDAA